MPILDPKKHTATNFVAPVRDANTPEALGPGHAASDKLMQPSPYWGTRRSGTPRPTTTTACSTARDAYGSPRRFRDANNPDFCKKGSDHPSAKAFPLERTNRQLTMLDPKTRPIHVRRYLLRNASSAVRLRRQRNAVDQRRRAGGRLGQHQDVRRDRRRREIPGLDADDPRYQRQRQARRIRRAEPAGRSDQGQADRRGLLRRDAEPGRRLDLGLVPDQSRGCRAGRAGIQSIGDGAHRDLQRADARLRHSWRRHRPARRRVGVARERPSGQFRSAQVQRPAQRAESHRRSLSRGLVVSPISGPRISRASARTARSRATTPGSTSTTPSVSARTCRCPPAT